MIFPLSSKAAIASFLSVYALMWSAVDAAETPIAVRNIKASSWQPWQPIGAKQNVFVSSPGTCLVKGAILLMARTNLIGSAIP